MPNKLRWYNYGTTPPTSFNIYRAVTGLVVEFPGGLVSGDKLVFSATSPTIQTIAIGSVAIDSVVALINAKAKGIVASKSTSGDKLYLRCTAEAGAKFKLLPCDFSYNTEQDARIIGPAMEYELIDSIPYVSGQDAYEYADNTGHPLDWYHITTVTGAVESEASLDFQAIQDDGLCIVEGQIVNLSGRGVFNSEVSVKIIVPVQEDTARNQAISQNSISTISDHMGRWRLPLLRSQQVLLQIPAIGYNQVVTVPDQDFVLFKDLIPGNDHYLNPAGDN